MLLLLLLMLLQLLPLRAWNKSAHLLQQAELLRLLLLLQ
jgi:hypothetical protein